jgi:hypothetical protein
MPTPPHRPTYLPTYLATCLPTYLPIHSSTYLPCQPTYLPTYLLSIILQLAFQNFHMIHKHGSNYVESHHPIDLNFHKGQNRFFWNIFMFFNTIS